MLGLVRPRATRWSTTTWLTCATVRAGASSSSSNVDTVCSSTLSAAALNPVDDESAQVERFWHTGGHDGRRVGRHAEDQGGADADRLGHDGVAEHLVEQPPGAVR